MPSTNSISAVIICFNEEDNIRRCLESLDGICSEIIIVDSFSTDNTIQICKNFGAQIHQRVWEGYSRAKNFGNDKASSDYILSLDADESISEKLKISILKAKREGLTGHYSLSRLTNYCGKWIKHAGWYPDLKIRLFPKAKSKWIGDHVHESLELDSALSSTILDGELYHFSYKSKAEHLAKESKYTLLAAKRDMDKNHSLLGAYLSAIFKFINMYFLKLGILDGRLGLQLCRISAISKITKYQHWKRLHASESDQL